MASDPALTVSAVARRLGVAPATLRSWERRYGLGAPERVPGARRRYAPDDVAQLTHMRRLTLEGVAPAEAARLALGGLTRPPGPEARQGGRGLAVPGGGARARGLARAAVALDHAGVRRLLDDALAADGVIATWDLLLAPVLRAVGERWAATGDGVEVEHLLAEAAVAAFAGRAHHDPASPSVLLACADGEAHSLPLHALAAALAERRVPARNLGTGLPAAALAAAVQRTGPAAVVLYAHGPATADPRAFTTLPVQRPPTALLAAGGGWAVDRLPKRVAYVHDLGEAVHLAQVATGAG